MSDFIVSARKYRPNSFSTVVGQSSITQTLENAITQNQLAHAYLFCGPRGVGKTSCARIFARAINKEHENDDRDFEFNIFELDAASNNGVDDIRQLIDQVRIQPQVGKYKVYIIDEVHMLSKAAFNAFLKTLEEPPSHAIFILATTEKHKILPTILSRCQIYDFNRITTDDIAAHLAFVAKSEDVNADSEALYLLAQKADGALRDALSIFDQIVSFNGKEITYERVLENLNILDFEFFFRLTALIKSNDRSGIFLLIEEILSNGFELDTLLSGAAKHFRDLMVCKDQRTLQLLEVSERMKQRYFEQSRDIEEKYLLNALHFINETEVQLKSSSNRRILVELTLLKIANLFGKPKEKKTPDGAEFRAAKEPLETKPNVILLEKENSLVPNQADPKSATIAENPKLDKALTYGQGREELNPIEGKPATSNALEPDSSSADDTVTANTRVSEQALLNEQRDENEKVDTEGTDRNREASSVIRPLNSISIHPLEEESPVSQVAEEIVEYVPETKEEEIKEIDRELLMQSWKDYSEILKQDGMYNLHAYFLNNDPKISGNTISLGVDNKVIETAINETKQNLLAHLQKQLDYNSLRFECVFEEKNEKIPAHVSTAERLEQMMEDNPALKNLQEQMDLGLE